VVSVEVGPTTLCMCEPVRCHICGFCLRVSRSLLSSSSFSLLSTRVFERTLNIYYTLTVPLTYSVIILSYVWYHIFSKLSLLYNVLRFCITYGHSVCCSWFPMIVAKLGSSVLAFSLSRFPPYLFLPLSWCFCLKAEECYETK